MVKVLDVLVQRTGFDGLLIAFFVHWLPIEYIVANRPTLDPGCLGNISNGAKDLNL